MNNLKHVGIYVEDLEKEKLFYKNVFNFKLICDSFSDTGELYKQLFDITGNDAVVSITKMVTEYGSDTGIGEMLELIQVIRGCRPKYVSREVYDLGISHISFGVDNIAQTVELALKNDGKRLTDILHIGKRKCCFCLDPEGNVLELIE